MKNIKNLKKSKYFKDLEDQDFTAFLRCVGVQVREVLKDETIVYDGDTTDNLFIVFSGSARSYSIDIDGNRKIIADYGKDSIFGIEYYTSKTKYYKEYLKAIENSTILVCDSFRFLNPCQNRCKRHVDCMRAVFEDLSKQLLNNKRRVSHICQSKTREKVMNYLTSVRASVKKDYFTIPYNRQELADYLGLERTALSAELSKMKAEGLIDFDKNDFRILKK